MTNKGDYELIKLAPNALSAQLAIKFFDVLRAHFPLGDFSLKKNKLDVYLQEAPNNFVGLKYMKRANYVAVLVFGLEEELNVLCPTLNWRKVHNNRLEVCVCNISTMDEMDLIVSAIKYSYMLLNKKENITKRPSYPWCDSPITTPITIESLQNPSMINNIVTLDSFLLLPGRFAYNPNIDPIVPNEGKLKTRVLKSPEIESKYRGPVRAKKLQRTKEIICECCNYELQKLFGRYLAELIAQVHHKDEFSNIPDSGIAFNVDEDALIWCPNCHSFITEFLKINSHMTMANAITLARKLFSRSIENIPS